VESIKGKLVFITGASLGIGKASAFAFAEMGCRLIISSRRKEMVDQIAEEIREKHKIEVVTLKIDVRSEEEVRNAINSLPDELKKIDILINNAGLAMGFAKLYEDDPENWEVMIDTNIKGLLYVTHAVVKLMAERESGHVINIGSIAGHTAYPNGSVYCATKHAVAAITNSLRMDVLDKNIRVSTVDPGMVETNFSVTRFHGDEERAKSVYKGYKPLTAEDIAETVVFCATRPPHVNINEMVVMPSVQANPFMLHKK